MVTDLTQNGYGYNFPSSRGTQRITYIFYPQPFLSKSLPISSSKTPKMSVVPSTYGFLLHIRFDWHGVCGEHNLRILEKKPEPQPMSTTFVTIVSATIALAIHYLCHKRRKKAVWTPKDNNILELHLMQRTVAELRELAESIGYNMDSSRVTKHLLVEMIMSRADQAQKEKLKAHGHDAKKA